MLSLLVMTAGIFSQGHENIEQVSRTLNFWDYAHDIAVLDGYVYVATGLSGLQALDVSDPDQPEPVGSWENNPGYSRCLTVSGNYAYVADWNHGFVIIDIENPAQPFEVGRYEETIAIRDMQVIDGYVYIIDASDDDADGFRIIDVSDPEHPELVGLNEDPDWAYSLAIAGDYAYVTEYDYRESLLRIFDISDPTDPVSVQPLDLEGRETYAAVSGDVAYVTVQNTDSCDYYILDISQPDMPEVVDACVFEPITGLLVQEETMYMLTGRNGTLYTFDISNPEEPREIGHCDTHSHGEMACNDGFLCIAAENDHLQIVDVSDQENPQVLEQYIRKGIVQTFGLFDGVAWVSGSSSDALYKLDISDPLDISIIDADPDIIYGNIYVNDDIACVMVGTNTFDIVDCSDPTSPNVMDRMTFWVDDG